MKTKILLGLSIAYLFASVGCKKDSNTTSAGKQTPKLTITSSNTMNEGSTLVAAVTSTAGKAGGVFTYAIQAGSGSATVNSMGTITAVSVGTVTLTVHSVGDANYNGATASQLITIVAPGVNLSQTLSLQSSDMVSALDDHVMTEGDELTGFLTGFAPGAIIACVSSDVNVATVAIDQTTGAITITAKASGNVILTFDAPAYGNYNAAPSVTYDIEVVAKPAPAPAPQPTDASFSATYSVDFRTPLLTLHAGNLKLNTSKVVVIVYEPVGSGKTLAEKDIKFWGTIDAAKFGSTGDGISSASDYNVNTTADAKKLNKTTTYMVAVYSVDDTATTLVNKGSAVAFYQANKLALTTGVLQKQFISYSTK